MKAVLAALLCAAPLGAADPAPAAAVADHLGLQMYSLRVRAMQQGWRSALDEAYALGFRFIESGGPPAKDVTAQAYDAQLAARGLTRIFHEVVFGGSTLKDRSELAVSGGVSALKRPISI